MPVKVVYEARLKWGGRGDRWVQSVGEIVICSESREQATVKVDKKVVRPVMAYGLETMTLKQIEAAVTVIWH